MVGVVGSSPIVPTNGFWSSLYRGTKTIGFGKAPSKDGAFFSSALLAAQSLEKPRLVW
jgi:hypothetical protein